MSKKKKALIVFMAVATIFNLVFSLYTFAMFDRENSRRAAETKSNEVFVEMYLIHPLAVPPEIVNYMKQNAEAEGKYRAERTRIIERFGDAALAMYGIKK
jgi:hypothetical protein